MRVAIVAGICAVLSSGAATAQSTASEIRERVAAELLRFARVGPGDVVYDLGSNGTIPAAAAKLGARAVPIAPDALLTALYADATVVVLDLTPALNLRLEPILRRQLRPGARIVSHRFGIGAWRADDSMAASDKPGRRMTWRRPRR